MDKHLVIVGAGHAHMTVLQNLKAFIAAGHRVTVIGPGPYHYYSGMGPGMLSGIYRPEEIRFEVRDMAARRGAAFVEDRVVRVDPVRRLIHRQLGEPIGYDVVSFNTGSTVPVDPAFGDADTVVPVKPIENLMHARSRIIGTLPGRRLALVVAGGGPAGLEVAANLRRLVEDAQGQATVTLAAGDRLLPGMSSRIRRRARQKLARRGVQVIEGVRVAGFGDGAAGLSSGERLPCDFLFMAVGVRPSPLFADSGLPTGPGGGLLVNAYLQSPAHPEIFGGGDCISFGPRPLARVGVYAVRQNPILLQNLQRALEGRRLLPFHPQRRFLLAFNMGDGTAIVSWTSLVFGGRLGFALKDHLDRSFMRRFQDKL
jgi:NADH dehydrogenase FAD-containing subunit